jgi:phosphatidylglycerol:prolipoprotein diacylglycerol transferase
MHPVLYSIGGLTIHWYGVLMALGFLAGMLNWIHLGRREGRDVRFCSDLLFWVMAAGIVGARLAYVVANLRSFALNPLMILRVDQGGLIYYGGFVGAGLAIYYFARIRGEKLATLMDFVITSVPLGHAFGRVGCFMNGCCYGKVHDGWLSVSFPAGSLAWWQHVDSRRLDPEALWSLPVYPVQILEAVFNLLLFGVLARAYRHRRGDGEILGLYLMTYPVARFLFEHLRVAAHGRVVGLSSAQYLSALLVVFGAVLFVRARRKTPRTAAE